MTPDLRPTEEELVHYAAGEGDAARRARVAAWIAEDRERQRAVDELQQLFARVAQRPERSVDVDVLVQRVESKIAVPARAATVRTPRRPMETRHTSTVRLRRRWHVPAIVAAVAVAVTIPAVWFYLQPGTGRFAGQTYITQRGERAAFALPDGTQVTLAPDTRIQYAAGPDGAREITLTGQAYFAVTHDPGRTFTVRTGDIRTRVLGTAFSVRAYPGDSMTQVAVAEGRVALQTPVREVVLQPGDMGWARPNTEPALVRDARIADAFGWMRGQLRFDDVPFVRVLAELSRTYDVDIRVSDPVLLQRRINAIFADEPARAVFNLVAIGLDATYTMSGSTVTFAPRR